jgi:two-component system response regulator DevR
MHLVRMQSGAATGETLAALSPQERRVLALVAKGKTNKEVGEQLGLSGNTVKNYLGNVFEKLRLKHRAQAAAFYIRNSSSK